MTPADPVAWAAGWVEAWNRRDLDAVLSGWAEEGVFTSPRLQGSVVGKAAVRAWWESALTPGLAMTLRDVLVGHDSVVVVYVDQRGATRCEVFEFDDAGLVVRAAAHG